MLLVCLIYSPWFDDAIDRSFPVHLRCETDKVPKMSQIACFYSIFAAAAQFSSCRDPSHLAIFDPARAISPG